MTRCPFCKESIIAGATRCKHCQSELPARSARSDRLTARVTNKLNTFRTGFLTGVVFSLIIAFLIYRTFA